MSVVAFLDGHHDLVYVVTCDAHRWAGCARYDRVNAEMGQQCPTCDIDHEMEAGRARYVALPPATVVLRDVLTTR